MRFGYHCICGWHCASWKKFEALLGRRPDHIYGKYPCPRCSKREVVLGNYK